VESALEAHPSVRQAVAVGQPDQRLGEKVCAFVVCVPGGSFDLVTCREWFQDRGLAKFKTPERVVVLPEMPVLAAGKIDRSTLRKRAAQE
jgi:non-ribosomal peptide synthetase component E (peptide arylation enzyme)